MSPLDAETMVALHVEEILRQHKASSLGWEARREARPEDSQRHEHRFSMFQPARRAIGTALIRAGLWLMEGTAVAGVSGQGTGRASLVSFR